jgi:hypothetical protein
MLLLRMVSVALLLAAPFFSGCKSPTSVIEGNVTYDGAPIHHGQITFSPVGGGQGRVCSAPIEAGKYRVENVPPGKKIVEIIGVKQVHFARTHDEMAKAAEAAKHGAAIQETADEVPEDAVGNNQTLETTLGPQELNFDLKPPAQ